MQAAVYINKTAMEKSHLWMNWTYSMHCSLNQGWCITVNSFLCICYCDKRTAFQTSYLSYINFILSLGVNNYKIIKVAKAGHASHGISCTATCSSSRLIISWFQHWILKGKCFCCFVWIWSGLFIMSKNILNKEIAFQMFGISEIFRYFWSL